VIFWLLMVSLVALLSLSWAVWADNKVDRTLGIYTFLVASGLFIYSIMKG
jgi:hypothetical protein